MTSKGSGGQCQGVTAKGDRCKNKALEGRDYCVLHMDQEKTEPGQDLFAGHAETPSEQCMEAFKEAMEFIRRRRAGDYEIDSWGRDDELTQRLMFIGRFIYKYYWRVTVTGVENIPAEGRCLMVANHSGVLPYDGAMTVLAVQEEHPQPRLVRALVLSLVFKLPVTGPLLLRLGGVQASPENAESLLEQDELVLVFPEGIKGIGKPFSKRYQLARFGRGGFTRTALKTRSPIVPVSIVGAEEIHPKIGNIKPLASLFGIPYIPITPTFPWLGPLGAVPLPTKWHIHFDAPIRLQDLDHRPSEEPLLVSKVSNQVRDTIQRSIYDILKKRRSVFFG